MMLTIINYEKTKGKETIDTMGYVHYETNVFHYQFGIDLRQESQHTMQVVFPSQEKRMQVYIVVNSC